MTKKGKIAASSLFWLTFLPLWGGTGRPSDGFLSFTLVLGFLGILFGILYLIDLIKMKIRKFLDGIGEAIL